MKHIDSYSLKNKHNIVNVHEETHLGVTKNHFEKNEFKVNTTFFSVYLKLDSQTSRWQIQNGGRDFQK